MGRNQEDTAIIVMKNITKYYPGVKANDNVYFEARAGEVHGLLGENGAGKTTLMNILYGLVKPDNGEIWIYGKRVNLKKWSPAEALKNKIVMVHQHFKLIPRLTVLDNIILGLRGAGIRISVVEAREKINKLAEEYGLMINPNDYIWQLSAGEKQRVELIRALMLDARILIMDEPTSVLTVPEIRGLFKILRKMAEEGRSIIFITHKLWEALEICDRITVMRRGKSIDTLLKKDATPEKLAKLMFGRVPEKPKGKTRAPSRRRVLHVRGLWVRSDRGHWAVKNAGIEVYAGEIVGIAGVAGSGQRELVEAIVGLRKAEKGCIRINGADITNASPREIADKGVAYIPEDRLGIGIVAPLSIVENSIMRKYWKRMFSGKITVKWDSARKYAEKLIEKYEIKSPGPEVPAGKLSGGNIQKLIIARELSEEPRLVIAHNPTMGLDVRSAMRVHEEILRLASKDTAILLVSEELEEILELSDRVYVMYNGELLGPFNTDEVSLEDLGYMMVTGRPIMANKPAEKEIIASTNS